MDKKFFYEIEEKNIHRISFSKALVNKEINLSNLYIKDFDDTNCLIINSFKHKAIILPKKKWLEDKLPANLFDILETPTIDKTNLNIFENILSKQENFSSQQVFFIFAITYKCNLHCSYCYQQHDKSLNKKIIDGNDLKKVFKTILDYKQAHQNIQIEIGLFGGEPLLLETYKIITDVLKFCTENLIRLHITTNGINLNIFLKLLIIHRNLISSINTTIDSIELNNITRCPLPNTKCSENNANQILKSVKLLLQYNVPVSIATNIDAHNVFLLKDIHDYFRDNNFFVYSHFRWDIGRVDDRLNETNYQGIISEAKILQALMELDNPPLNLHAAFLKTTHFLCKSIGLDFNQTEQKGMFNYCWASSDIDKVFYIDNDLDVFRCTYTVGRKKFKLFKFSYKNIDSFVPVNRSFLGFDCCQQCKIGGYCSGGCSLSFQTGGKKQCKYELENFDSFINEIYIPIIKNILTSRMAKI